MIALLKKSRGGSLGEDVVYASRVNGRGMIVS
jgi:hypothetical protein